MVFFSLGLHVESSLVYRHFQNTPCVKCRRLESKIRAVMFSVEHFARLGFTSAGVAPLPPRFRASSWTRQSRPSPLFPRVNNFSIVTTNACCRFREARAAFTTADGKVAKSATCCPMGPSRCFDMMSMVSRKISSPSLSLCAGIVLTRLSARYLPSSWPDTASFRSCL